MATELILRAITFATQKHHGQTRKDGKTPYSSHPMRVMTVAAHVFGISDPEVLAAAVLHDTLEDTTADRDDLVKHFGERVAEIVVYLTKDKRLPEAEREATYFAALLQAPVEVRLCKLADAYDNSVNAQTLEPAARAKTRRKSTHVLEMIRPTLPVDLVFAAERLREQIEKL